MTQEEKQLLFKDISERLPYGVLFQDMEWPKTPPSTMGILDYWRMECKIYGDEPYRPIEEFKMYLRPMSSMTDEETRELLSLRKDMKYPWIDRILDFYLSHHLDWRGLIPMGLALEAPEGMYKAE